MKRRTGLFIGRFQPFHEGHKKCVEKILEDTDHCVILLRDSEHSAKNPYDTEKRNALIRSQFSDSERVSIQIISDPGCDLSVFFGRDVGYNVIKLDAETEAISATEIRRTASRSASKEHIKSFPIVWLTGNSGAGKTTLAQAIDNVSKEDASLPFHRRVVVLDGDEMRETISLGAGFSFEDRREHNLRVARLAKLFQAKGFLVLVSVIAPFKSVRKELSAICNPLWVFVKRERGIDPDRPYEPPEHPTYTLDMDRHSKREATDLFSLYLRDAVNSKTQQHECTDVRI